MNVCRLFNRVSITGTIREARTALDLMKYLLSSKDLGTTIGIKINLPTVARSTRKILQEQASSQQERYKLAFKIGAEWNIHSFNLEQEHARTRSLLKDHRYIQVAELKDPIYIDLSAPLGANWRKREVSNEYRNGCDLVEPGLLKRKRTGEDIYV